MNLEMKDKGAFDSLGRSGNRRQGRGGVFFGACSRALREPLLLALERDGGALVKPGGRPTIGDAYVLGSEDRSASAVKGRDSLFEVSGVILPGASFERS